MPTMTTDRYGWIRTFESTQLIGLNLICEIYLIFAKYLMDYLSHANAVTRHAPLSPPFEVQKSTWNRNIANFWILDPMRMQNSKINSPKGTVRVCFVYMKCRVFCTEFFIWSIITVAEQSNMLWTSTTFSISEFLTEWVLRRHLNMPKFRFALEISIDLMIHRCL